MFIIHKGMNMNVNLAEERKVLIEKKNVIQEELKEKKLKFQEVGKNLSKLQKEMSTYSEEKIANELIFNRLTSSYVFPTNSFSKFLTKRFGTLVKPCKTKPLITL